MISSFSASPPPPPTTTPNLRMLQSLGDLPKSLNFFSFAMKTSNFLPVPRLPPPASRENLIVRPIPPSSFSRARLGGPKASYPCLSYDRRETLKGLLSSALDALQSMKKLLIAAVFVSSLLATDGLCALAASGGRMGGSCFPSSSSSKSSYSSSWSSPSSSSSSWWSSPSPSSFSSWRINSRPTTSSEEITNKDVIFMVLVFASFLYFYLCDHGRDQYTATKKASVLKLQVALLGLKRSMQKELDRIAEASDTSNRASLHYILQETVVALLRNPNCCISAYSSMDVKQSIENGKKLFNEFLIEERIKIDKETLVNVNGIKVQKITRMISPDLNNENIVVDVKQSIENGNKLFKEFLIEERVKLDEETLVNVNDIKAQKTTGTISPDFSSEYIVVDVKQSIENGNKLFNEFLIEERVEIDEETLVNVNDIKAQKITGMISPDLNSEYIVVDAKQSGTRPPDPSTENIVVIILVAAEGDHKLPAISSSSDLKNALKMLASIATEDILAVEVLWTPQEENDSLSDQELLVDYPLLRPL